MSFDQYSETPASNYITGYFLTGMAPSSVKVAGSDIMADLASRFAAMHTSGGTSTAYTVTQTRQFASLVNGLELIWLPNATNTGAATLAPDGLAAKNIFANGAAIIAGMIVQNVPAYCKYDGTQWNLINPQAPTGSYTGTGTGLTTSPTCTIKYCITSDGSTCTLIIGTGVTGTSNSANFTITGGPAFLAPISTQAIACFAVDNTSNTQASFNMVASSSAIQLGKGTTYGTGGFTASGSKTFPSGSSVSFTYQLKV